MALESRFYFWPMRFVPLVTGGVTRLTTRNADGGSSVDAVKGNDCSIDDVRVALHDILIMIMNRDPRLPRYVHPVEMA
jgi:hypothetical protein